MKRLTPLKYGILTFLTLAGVANSVATHLRHPSQLGLFSDLATVAAVIFSSILIINSKTKVSLVFCLTLLAALIIHWCYWAFGKIEAYASVGTETWSGDGIGVALEGMTFISLMTFIAIFSILSIFDTRKNKDPANK